MKKTFYIQVEPNTNRITDIAQDKVSALAKGYIPIELDTPLPQHPTITACCYAYMDGSIVYRKEWDKSEDKQKIIELETTVIGLMDVIAGGSN